MPGAFDYGAKNAQQRVALLGKETAPAPRVLAGLAGPKVYYANLTAGVWVKPLSISGSGALNFASMNLSGAGTGTLKMRITVDGRLIFNGTCAVTTNYHGFVGVGYALVDAVNSVVNYSLQRIPFEKSLSIEVTDTESNQVQVWADYEVNV